MFDLSVQGVPEFFANGILVHNSTDCAVIARKIIGTLISTGTVKTAETPADKRAAAEMKRQLAGAEPSDRDEEASQGGSFSGMLVGGYDDSWGNF